MESKLRKDKIRNHKSEGLWGRLDVTWGRAAGQKHEETQVMQAVKTGAQQV